MSLTQEKIKSLQKLTALKGGQNLNIESVLDSFDSIQKVSLDPSQAVTRSGKGNLLPRIDVVKDSHLSDELLACSPQKILAHQITLSSIMHGE